MLSKADAAMATASQSLQPLTPDHAGLGADDSQAMEPPLHVVSGFVSALMCFVFVLFVVRSWWMVVVVWGAVDVCCGSMDVDDCVACSQ